MTMKVTSEDAAGIEITGVKKGNYDKGYETKKKVAVIEQWQISIKNYLEKSI